MSIKNILNLGALGVILLALGTAAVLVDPLFWCATAGSAIYIPEALSEVE
jgi:hypothetical protein